MRNMRVVEKSLPAKAHALLADRRRRNDSPWVFQMCEFSNQIEFADVRT